MLAVLFYIAGAVALVATILAVTRSNAAHALIYLIVSLLAVAVMFFLMGAPFAAALEIVIYAGAIMVLFLFVIMLLNLDELPLDRCHVAPHRALEGHQPARHRRQGVLRPELHPDDLF